MYFTIFNNISLFILPDFAFTHWEPIAFTTIVPVIILYVAYTISAQMECLSDHGALGGIIGVDLYKEPGLARIFCGEGLANLMSSVSGLNYCSYGESVATVGFSKVASVRVTRVAAGVELWLEFHSERLEDREDVVALRLQPTGKLGWTLAFPTLLL